MLVVESGGETHEVSANVTVETSATPVVKSRSQLAAELSLITFGLSVPHDILLGKSTIKMDLWPLLWTNTAEHFGHFF